MRNRNCWITVAVLLGAACDQQPSAPASRRTSRSASVLSSAHTRRAVLSPEEETLLQSLKATMPGRDADTLERYVRDPSSGPISISNPRVQAMLDRLDTLKARRLDSLAAVSSGLANMRIEKVTLVLLDALPDTSATAIVERRTDQTPRNVIALGSRHASPGALGAALNAITKMLRAEGTGGPVRNARVVVHGEMLPKAWHAGLVDQARRNLDELTRRAPSQIDGFGVQRSMEITVAR
jgi:hypothetical protein